MDEHQRPPLEQRIIAFLFDLYVQNKPSATFREIATKLQIRSTNTIHNHVLALERDGIVVREKKKARSIRLATEYINRWSDKESLAIRLLGTITAGAPIFVPEPGSSWYEAEGLVVAVPRSHLINFDITKLFALRVKGDSMIDACILDGDIIIIKYFENPRFEVQDGDMVAAWIIDEERTTLKRYYDVSDKVELRPANPSYDTIPVRLDNIRVYGKVVYSYRQLQ